MEILKIIASANPNAWLLDGFDAALIGCGRQAGSELVAVYDRAALVAVLVRSGMTDIEAEEYIQHNIEVYCVGEHAPIIAIFQFPTDRDCRNPVAKT